MAQIGKFRDLGNFLNEIFTFWQMKNGIFGSKILWSLTKQYAKFNMYWKADNVVDLVYHM